MFQKHPEIGEPAEKKFEVIAEKAWKLSKSSDPKGTNVVQDWESLVNLIKNDGWDKDSQDMDKFWRSKRQSDAQMTPTRKGGGSLDIDCGQKLKNAKV